MEGNNNRHTSVKVNGSSLPSMASPSPDGPSTRLPALFERSKRGFLNPRFDSDELEEQLEVSFFPLARGKFRAALLYVAFCCVVWAVWFGVRGGVAAGHIAGAAVLLLLCVVLLTLTFHRSYPRHRYKLSAVLAAILPLACAARLIAARFSPPAAAPLSPVGSFCAVVEVVLLIYHFIPLPLYAAVGLATLHSVINEALFFWMAGVTDPTLIVGESQTCTLSSTGKVSRYCHGVASRHGISLVTRCPQLTRCPITGKVSPADTVSLTDTVSPVDTVSHHCHCVPSRQGVPI